MKIYTKKGDSGKTSIIGQKSINKHNVRIEAYGSVDELNSYMGLIRSYKSKDLPDLENQIVGVQNNLFIIGAALATKKILDPNILLMKSLLKNLKIILISLK